MAGRPTKFTIELGKALCSLAREGKSRIAVAALAGLGKKTLQNWLGDDPPESIGDAERDEFVAEYAHAEAEVEARRVDVVEASDQWQAHTWLLERTRAHWRLPKDDSSAHEQQPPQVVVVQVPAGSSVQIPEKPK